MGSVLAIVSKAVFERLANADAELGDVLGIDRYTSKHAALATLADGGSLFLVTVRPPDEALWLVAVLENPTVRDDGWHARANTVPITDISALRSRLRFASGTGIQAKTGALGMSLQTPRVLTAEDVALLRGGAPVTSTKTTAKPAAKAAAKLGIAKAAGKTASAKPASKTSIAKAVPAAKAGAKPATAHAVDPIEAVRDAIAAKDAIAALDAALVAWRAQRAAPLAELVEALGVRVTGPTVTDDRKWAEVAASRDPVHLGSLLRGLPELPVSFLPAAADLLVTFADDPRLATAIATWTLDPPTTSSSTYPFWTKSLDALVQLGDARVIPTLRKRLKMPQVLGKFAGANKPSKFWPKFYAAIEKVIAKLDARPEVTVDRKAIASLTAAAKKLQIGGTPAPRTARVEAAAGPAVTGPALVQAVAHASAGRIAPALEALVAAWREQRAPELADRIDRATRLLPSYDQPFPVEPKAMHAAWMQAVADDPIGSLPRLLQHVDRGGSGNAERQVIALARLPDDPRTSLRLAEIAGANTISPERTQYWKTLWEIVARTADVRVVVPLNRQFRDFTGTYYNHHRQGRRILGDFVAQPPAAPTLDAAAHKLVNQLDAALAKLEAARDTVERDLIAAIAKDWRDDGPRLVYADWLSEREHPRGEAIVLACKDPRSDAETKRLHQLVGRYRDRTHIYGPMSDLEPQHERGLPATLAANWSSSTLTWRRVAGDPLLPLVDTIAFEVNDPRGEPLPEDLAPVLLDPTAKRLAQVTGVPGELGDALIPLLGKRWKRKGDTFVRA